MSGAPPQNNIFEISTPDELPAVAQAIVSAGPGVVLLMGELGAGKTTLVKALCLQLGSTEEVTSPTFTLVNEYRDQNGRPIYHIDLYRLNTVDEALQIGIEDYLLSGAWCFIEWPEKIIQLLEKGAFLTVSLEVLPDGNRRICILK